MSYARSFAPWIAYAAVSAVADWRAAAAIAFVVAAKAVREQHGTHGEVDDLTQATKWFFGALAVLSLLRPDSPLHPYTPALSLAVLGAAAVASLLQGRPFTLAIARRSVPEEVWHLPTFVEANVTITRVWAASFLATAAVCAATIALAPALTALWVGAEVVGFVVPVLFTAVYRDRARARFAAATTA